MNARLAIVNNVLNVLGGGANVTSLDEGIDDLSLDILQAVEKKHLKMQLLEGCRSNIIPLKLNKNTIDGKWYLPNNVIKILSPRLLNVNGTLHENVNNSMIGYSPSAYYDYTTPEGVLSGRSEITIWVKVLQDFEYTSHAYRNALEDEVASQLMLLRSDTPREAYHKKEVSSSMISWLQEELNYDPINVLEAQMWRMANPNGKI